MTTCRFEVIPIYRDFPLDTPVLEVKAWIKRMGWKGCRVILGHNDTVRVIRRKP